MRLGGAIIICVSLSGCGAMSPAMSELALRSVLNTGVSVLGDIARQAASRAITPGFAAPLNEGRLSP